MENLGILKYIFGVRVSWLKRFLHWVPLLLEQEKSCSIWRENVLLVMQGYRKEKGGYLTEHGRGYAIAALKMKNMNTDL